MAFCNACGTNIVPGTRFCSKCGAAILASTLPPATQSPGATGSSTPVPPIPGTVAAPPPTSGGGALKVILIVVGVVVLLGVLGIASLAFFGWQVARHAHVQHDGDNVKVDTPFGTVESTKDPQEAARNIGVDLYPGAEVLKDGSASVTFGSVHTVTLSSESTDSADKVCSFYKPKFPNAMVMSSDSSSCTIVSNDGGNNITVKARTDGDKTRIVISHISKAGAAN